MLEAFAEGFALATAWPAIGFLLIGVSIGMVVGLLPGLGGTLTIVLMLPFLFYLEPVEGFAMLLGMAATTNTAGDITSVLFGVPGEATTAATVVDGYAMTKNGEAGRALGAVLMSSMVGALIGATALLLAIPIVRPLVLSLFYPDFLMLAVVGVFAIAAMSGSAPLRGVLAGVIGALLATVGLDPGTGISRMTFGSLYLYEGIPLEAMALGLFAVPSLIDMAMRGSASAAIPTSGMVAGVWRGIKDVFVHWKVTLGGSLVGTGIGIIPGLGGAVSQWIAYSTAVALSPNKSRFGKGAVEGVIGPGAANNSKDGASLIPTIAFGIPSSVTMGLLLGAFVLTGLVPGREMLTTNLPITLSFVWMIILGNLIAVPVLLVLAPQLAKLSVLAPARFVPLVLAMVLLAAYAADSKWLDVATMTSFGLLGYLMLLTRWPRGPMIVGFILAPIIERNFRYAYAYYGFNWITNPGVIILAIVAVLVLVVGSKVARAVEIPAGGLDG